jgi:hypothetical protein
MSLSKSEKQLAVTLAKSEDAEIRKKSLCEQLQLLGLTANTVRSKKLQFAADVYGI